MDAPSPTDLEAVVQNVIQELAAAPASPHIRELRAKALTYERVIASWATYPPTSPQVQAMRECVEELQEKVRSAPREGSGLSRKPTEPGLHAIATPGGAMRPPPPATIPPGVAWNANVNDATGVRARTRRDEDMLSGASPASGSGRPTSKPPTHPPVSAPRPIHTPTPALRNSRRSR